MEECVEFVEYPTVLFYERIDAHKPDALALTEQHVQNMYMNHKQLTNLQMRDFSETDIREQREAFRQFNQTVKKDGNASLVVEPSKSSLEGVPTIKKIKAKF